LSLASNPKLLLLDEPSCGLTTSESSDISKRVHELGSKITLILVAHDMDLVFSTAERIMLLHYGEVICEGSAEEIRNNSEVKKIYIGNREC
jgi:branched-chain amino acid transport system ATP-binding protein